MHTAGSIGLSVLLFNSFGSLAVDRSVGVSPLTSIDCCCGDSLLLLVPVSTGLSVLLSISESRGLPRSHHFVALVRTSSSFGTSFG
jgi:hypothetical protein